MRMSRFQTFGVFRQRLTAILRVRYKGGDTSVWLEQVGVTQFGGVRYECTGGVRATHSCAWSRLPHRRRSSSIGIME